MYGDIGYYGVLMGKLAILKVYMGTAEIFPWFKMTSISFETSSDKMKFQWLE